MGQLLPHTFVGTSNQCCIMLELRNLKSLMAKRSLLFFRKSHAHVLSPICLLTLTSYLLPGKNKQIDLIK